MQSDNRLQALLPILSELLPPTTPGSHLAGTADLAGTMRIYAMAELAVIARGWQRFKAQGELMRIVGARPIEDGSIPKGGLGRQGGVGGGRGMNIFSHRFNPGVTLSQVQSSLVFISRVNLPSYSPYPIT